MCQPEKRGDHEQLHEHHENTHLAEIQGGPFLPTDFCPCFVHLRFMQRTSAATHRAAELLTLQGFSMIHCVLLITVCF